MLTTVRLAQIKPILDAAKRAGIDVKRLTQQHLGISDWQVAPDPLEISLTNYFRIERDIAQHLDDLTAQMSTRRLTYMTGNFVLSQIQQCHTLNDAIKGLADYFNMMHGGVFNSVRQTSNLLTMVIDDRDFPYTLSEDRQVRLFLGDCVLLKTHCLLNSLSDGKASLALKRIGITRDARSSLDIHLRYWPTPITLGRETYELVYDLELALQPLYEIGPVDLSAAGIFARVIGQLDAQDKGSQPADILGRIVDLIKDGVTQQGAVAQSLGISVATLRRRLAADGLKFRDLILDERHALAKRLLSDGQSVRNVAEQLDYSDIRAFSRAFKKRFGVTPANFRKQIRTNAPP